MAQAVWCDFAAKLGQPHRLLDQADRPAVELDDAFGNQFQASPPAHMAKQPRWRRRLMLLGGALANLLAIEDAALTIVAM